MATAFAQPPTTHASAGELLGSGEVEAAVIASPPGEHVWQAELASRSGIPALVEKPPAPSGAGAARLAELDPAPWIGFNRRFQHATHLVGQVPVEGDLSLELELRYRRASWQAVSVIDDAAADLAPHLVDLALLLAGDVRRVTSATLDQSRAELELELDRGRATIRCATDRPHRELVSVRDASGRAVGRSAAGGPVAAITGRLPGREHPLVGSLRAQLTAFVRAVRANDPGLLATAADGARVMDVIDRARLLVREAVAA
jgi:predicted dehydrogenase